MRQAAGYIPLLSFFLVWAIGERPVRFAGIEHSFGGIYSAAEVLLVTSVCVYGLLYLAHRRLDKMEWITLTVVVLACIPTILLRDVNFLKWKAPVANWLFALVFLGSHYIGDKPVLQHMLGHAVTMPRESWLRFSFAWVAFFVVLGAANLAVAYLLSESLWIQFKVFGNIIVTVLFVFGQMPWLAKHMMLPDQAAESKNPDSTGLARKATKA